MGDLNRGNTFVDGSTEVDAAALHGLVEEATLKSEAITDKSSTASLASGDKFLIYDASENGLRSLQYSVLASAVSAATTVGAIRKAVAASHSFAVGDVVRFKSDGTGYELATAALTSYDFATSDVNTSTNRITLPTNTVFNGEQVILSSSDTLPAPLVTGTRYYAKRIDATTFELYTDSGLTSIVDITDDGTGTHTLYNELERNHTVGIVTAAPDSSNFTVTLSGEATGLPASLTAGKVYFLSPTSAGDLTITPPLELGQVVQPVLVALTTSSGIVFQHVATPIAADSVRTEHIAPKAVGRAELADSVTRLLDRNLGSDRQTVLSGRRNSSTGIADFLEAGTGLQVVLKATTTDPCIISFANGFDEEDGYNFIEKLTTDQNFDALTASSELFLYVDRDSAGTLAYSFANRSPEYGFVKSLYRNRHAYPRLYATDTENGLTVTSSGAASGQQAYKAFNGEQSTYWEAGTTGAGSYLQTQYTYGKVINKYSIQCESTSRGPTAWTLEGRNDGSSWTTIDTRSSQTWTGASEVKTYEVTNTASYTYHKLTFTAIQGGSVACRIANLALCEAVNHYYSIPEGIMYYHDGSSWSAVNRVFVGEVRTGASSVSSGSTTAGLFTYAIRGLYVSPAFAVAGNAAYPLTSAIGTPYQDSDVYYRENQFYTWNKSEFATTTNNAIRVEVGYLLDDSATATNTLGGDVRLERLYTTAVAPGADVTSEAHKLTSNGASTTTFCEAYVVTRRLF